ncbi:hypothetical protein LZ005_04640 [Massilia sp. TS11]|nr:hypothetical protein [Massilia sp. TS11]
MTGVTLTTAGSTVTAADGILKFTDAGLAAGKTDTITAGNGDNVIKITAATAFNSIVTLGNGANNVDLSTATGGVQKVTVGSGDNVIKTGAGADVITVGAGTNTITGGAGADTFNLSGKANTLVFAAGDTGTNNATVTQTNELTSTFDIVKGAVAGDKIDLSALATSITGGLVLAGTNLAAQDQKIVFVTGTYDATNGSFTYSASGNDTAITWDTDASGAVSGQTIILVGFHATTSGAGATSIAANVITLG